MKNKVTWILEQNKFSEKCFDDMVNYFKENNINYHIVKVIPFVHEIDGDLPTVNNPVVVYGSVGIQKIANKNNWKPAVWTGNCLDEIVIRDKLREQYLNSDAIQCSFIDSLDIIKEKNLEIFFIKPNEDIKEFTGDVLEFKEYQELYNNILNNELNCNYDVVISSPKNTGIEWRFVIVNGKISSSSMYRNYRRLYQKQDSPNYVKEFVNDVIKIYNPLPVYVMDIVETDDGLKVVEYNTFNSSGLYSCNVSDIIKDINKLFGETQ